MDHGGYTDEGDGESVGEELEGDYSPFSDQLDLDHQDIKPEHPHSTLDHHPHHLNGHSALSVDPSAYGLGSLDPGPTLTLDHNHDHHTPLDQDELAHPGAQDGEWNTYDDRIKYEEPYGYGTEHGSPGVGFDDGLVAPELPAGAGEDEHEPLYVNAKQYHRIMKRRMARARLEEMGRLSRQRKVSHGCDQRRVDIGWR